jgi:bacillolysin
MVSIHRSRAARVAKAPRRTRRTSVLESISRFEEITFQRASRAFFFVTGAPALIVALVASSAPIRAQVDEDVFTAITALERASGESPEVTISPSTGLATFIAPRGDLARAMGVIAAAPEEAAIEFVRLYGRAFGLEDVSDVSVVAIGEPDATGLQTVRLSQVRGAVPVAGGQIAVQVRGGLVQTAHAKTLASLASVSTEPTVSSDDAWARVASMLDQVLGVTDATPETIRLEVLGESLFSGAPLPMRLAWFVEAVREGVRQYVWVDAETGDIILSFSQINEGLERRVFEEASPTSILRRSEGEPPTGDADVDDAYDFVGDTHAYFLDELGFDIQDPWGAITAVVHARGIFCPVNAWYDGSKVVFCDDMAIDDVVAHELGHHVTTQTAGLYYAKQSGALNESYSDIFGEVVDLRNGKGSDAPADRWNIGEDGPEIFRNMADPSLHGQPGKTSDSSYYCGSWDDGGVHTNSGVVNHAFALMADGGSYNGRMVTGIGVEKAARILFEALYHRLTPTSRFREFYDAANASCDDLAHVPEADVSVEDCAQVRSALEAVELNGLMCFPPRTSYICPGYAVQDVVFDDLEEILFGFQSWAIRALEGPDPWSGGMGLPPIHHDEFAASGTFHFLGRVSARADSTLEMVADVTVEIDSWLQFEHYHAFDTEAGDDGVEIYDDGGVVEYSADGGQQWKDAGEFIVAGEPYRGTLVATNPLGARSAFAGRTEGYALSVVDLTRLLGEEQGTITPVAQDLRFRSRMASGNRDAVASRWYIDDVRLYRCVDPGTRSDEKLVAGDGADFDSFGTAVDVEVTAELGTMVAVGAPSDVNTYWGREMRSGSVRVFHRVPDGRLLEEAVLIPVLAPDTPENATIVRFGNSVALSRDTLIAGAELDDEKGRDAGAAYVFRRSTDEEPEWMLEAKLTAADGGNDDLFGRSVAVSGDVAVVGAELADPRGAVYVFRRSGAAWRQVRKIDSPMDTAGILAMRLGYSVAIDGDLVAIRGIEGVTPPNVHGLAYVYRVTGDAVELEATFGLEDSLLPLDADLNNVRHGLAVAKLRATIDGIEQILRETVAIGDTGSVRVGHLLSDAEWRSSLVEEDGWAELDFDDSSWAPARAPYPYPYTPETLLPGTKAVHIWDASGAKVAYFRRRFELHANVTSAIAKIRVDDDFDLYVNGELVLSNSDRKTTIETVDLTEWLVAGENVIAIRGDDTVGLQESVLVDVEIRFQGVPGLVHVFEKEGGDWRRAGKLAPSDGKNGDVFGRCVDVDPERIVVGAVNHGGLVARFAAGSVYVFDRALDDANWSQSKWLAAPDGSSEDRFGTAVALSSPYVLAGAPGDDDLGTRSGSAYLFEFAPWALAPRIFVAPSSIDFGEVTVGTTDTTEIRLENPGREDIEGIAVELVAGSAPEFHLASVPPVTRLAPGTSISFEVAFEPAEAGEHVGAVRITSSGPTDPAVVPLRGLGTGGESRFRRGDVDGSERIEITDPIFVLQFLFVGGPEPVCRDAADADDSGALDITDGIRTLHWLFTGGVIPPLPGPHDCGPDPTDDLLDCASYPDC